MKIGSRKRADFFSFGSIQNNPQRTA
jgi:hypothetical protein